MVKLRLKSEENTAAKDPPKYPLTLMVTLPEEWSCIFTQRKEKLNFRCV